MFLTLLLKHFSLCHCWNVSLDVTVEIFYVNITDEIFVVTVLEIFSATLLLAYMLTIFRNVFYFLRNATLNSFVETLAFAHISKSMVDAFIFVLMKTFSVTAGVKSYRDILKSSLRYFQNSLIIFLLYQPCNTIVKTGRNVVTSISKYLLPVILTHHPQCYC